MGVNTGWAEFVDALKRKNEGMLHSPSEIKKTYSRLKILYDEWKEYDRRIDNLINVGWKAEEIEENYGTPKFYKAHMKLNEYRRIREEAHEKMFKILTRFDGFDIPYTWDAMGAEEIFEEFKAKYIKGVSDGKD